MKPIKKFVNNTTNEELHIFQDESSESPNDWGDNEIFLVYDYRQFQVDRKGFEPQDIFNYLYDKESNDKEFDDYFIFTVFAYIHSGVSLSLNHSGDRWDTSSTGFILVHKTKLDFELQKKHNDILVTKTDEEIAKHFAQGLIETWNQYLSGDVYGFKRFNKVDEISKLTNEIIRQFSLNRDFSGDAIKFAKTVIPDILTKNLPTNIVNGTLIENDSCYGYYGIESIFDEIDKEHWEEIKNE